MFIFSTHVLFVIISGLSVANANLHNNRTSCPTCGHSLSEVRWVWGSKGSVPDQAVSGGCRDSDGTLYIGLALHEGNVLPAKISPCHKVAYVSYKGKEHVKSTYKVLVYPDAVAWQVAKMGEVPPNAIKGGHMRDGEKLYIGRALHETSLTPGMIRPSQKALFIPFRGEQLMYEEYEVLVKIHKLLHSNESW